MIVLVSGPPHLYNLNVDVMWSNVDVLWSNVDFHISNVNKCIYILRVRIMEIYVHSWINRIICGPPHLKCGSNTSPHLDNVNPPHLHISTMWSFHTYTFDNLPYTLSQFLVDFSAKLKITMIVKDFWSYDSFLVLLWKYIK